VVYEGRPLSDPHLITLRLVSRFRRDIGNNDFNNGDPLEFDLQAPIIAPLGATTELTTPRGPALRRLVPARHLVHARPGIPRRHRQKGGPAPVDNFPGRRGGVTATPQPVTPPAS
jgi:hypothetical protein